MLYVLLYTVYCFSLCAGEKSGLGHSHTHTKILSHCKKKISMGWKIHSLVFIAWKVIFHLFRESMHSFSSRTLSMKTTEIIIVLWYFFLSKISLNVFFTQAIYIWMWKYIWTVLLLFSDSAWLREMKMKDTLLWLFAFVGLSRSLHHQHHQQVIHYLSDLNMRRKSHS